MLDNTHYDFFISYNKADKSWAEWVADVLETNGYTTIIQAWDFRPGQNFMLRMQEAAAKSDRTIGILSREYLSSLFTAPEWAAALVQDPTGADARFVPVRVHQCELTGLLSGIIYIDLVGKDEEDARAELLQGIGTERARPADRASFPGAEAPSARDSTGDAAGGVIEWAVLSTSPDVHWRGLSSSRYITSEGCTVQVHLVPESPALIPVSRLVQLPRTLSIAGRQAGLFPDTAGLTPRHDATTASVECVQNDWSVSGLLVTRSGQRGAWFSLPRDMMGPVFDPADVRSKLADILALLVGLDLPGASCYALAAAVVSPSMLVVDSLSVLDHRNSVSLGGFNSDDVLVEPTDTIRFADVQRQPDEVAGEVVARLEAALRSRR